MAMLAPLALGLLTFASGYTKTAEEYAYYGIVLVSSIGLYMYGGVSLLI